MKTILITGVAGLLGSRFADWVIKKIPDARVIGIDDLSGGFDSNLNKDIIFYNINILDDKLKEVFEQYKPDYVFHFAAYAAEGLSPFIRKYNYTNNLTCTTQIVNECIKHSVKRLIFTSTLAVYGHGFGGVFNEDQTPAPIDPYGVAKYACEMDIKIAGDQHGLDWCIIRPHNVYGVNQNIWDKYRNVLGIWMFQHINNLPTTIFGDGLQSRAFSYIDDILAPLWNAAVKVEASKEIINLGGIEEHTIIEANTLLRDIMGCDKVEFLEQRHEVKHSIPTWEKSVDILEFKHTTSLKEGLIQMWAWAQEQPMRERFVWPSYELDNGIYDYWRNK